MSAIRSWFCMALLLVLGACGGGLSEPDSPAVAAVVPARAGAAVIGASGGSVDAILEGGAGVRLDVPAGALPSDTTLRIDPASAPAGQPGSFTLSAGGATLRTPVTLTVTLPATPAPDADTYLLLNTGSRQIPLSLSVDPVTRTMTVELPTLGAAVANAGPAADARAHAQASSIDTTTLTVLLAHDPFRLRVNLLDLVTSDLRSDGSVVNATHVQLAMASLLGLLAANTDARIRADIGIWRDVVCAQQDFSVSALNSFNGADVPTFARLARDVLQWGRFAQDLGTLVARVSNPAESGCANLSNDFVQPVRDRLPAFLTRVTADLNLLDPNSQAGDFDLLFRRRATELFALAGDFANLGAVDLQSTPIRVVTGQLDRSRNVAYTTCRSVRDQKLQAKLLELVLTDPLLGTAASFNQADLWADIQFCGMPLHWKVVDGNGAVLQQGDAGGIGPGFTTSSATLRLTGAAKIVLSGPLAALICPVASQNNEQLVFSSGPLAGPPSSVQMITPSGTNQYLQSSSQDFDVATLQAQGAAKLVIARRGASCGGEFPGLTAHDTISTFVLDSSSTTVPVQITAASLPPTVVGLSYGAKVAASGGSAPFAWTASGLPGGLSLNAQTGVVSGIVATPGSYRIAFSVSSADGSTAQSTLTLNVVADVAGLYIGTDTNERGNVDQAGRFVSQSKNLVKVGRSPDLVGVADFFYLCELDPGGTLSFIGIAGSGRVFVPDPIATQEFLRNATFTGQIVGNVLTFKEIAPPSLHTYVLTKQ